MSKVSDPQHRKYEQVPRFEVPLLRASTLDSSMNSLWT